MIATPLAAGQFASVVAAVLIAGVVAFQVALALKAPLGDAVFGGRAPTREGVLSGPFRVVAILQAALLLGLGWVLLARTAVVAIPSLGDGSIVWLTWMVVGFLALNTVANFSAPHPVERWVMGPITLALTGLGLSIALAGSG